VTHIEWGSMLAGLEQQRTGLEQELADVDAVIQIARQRSAPRVAIADLTKPRATNGRKIRGQKIAKPAPKAAPSGKLSPDQVVRMSELYEAGKSVDEIATRFKVTTAAVYYYASSRKWKRPNPGAAAKPAAAAPTERMAEKLAGRVRCTSCDLWTDYDPCENCGKKLKRGW